MKTRLTRHRQHPARSAQHTSSGNINDKHKQPNKFLSQKSKSMRFSTLSTALFVFVSSVVSTPIEARNTGMYMIQIVNNCQQTIWPGVGQTVDSPGKVSERDGGFELTPGASKVIAVPNDWIAGRVFGRTGCNYNNGVLSCAVGDCGGLSCSQHTGVPDVTLAEFSYSDMVKTFYNISLISGFNLGMSIRPSDPSCETFTCGSAQCSPNQAYQPGASTNPCMGCSLSSGFIVTFCPA